MSPKNDNNENSEFRNTVCDSTSEQSVRISDSDVFDERSHPFQGTKTPTLNCPREIMERIFLLLDTNSILKCKLINREYNNIIQTSTLLQYYLACKAAGVIDNPRSSISYGERLEALRQREEAWKTLKPVFKKTIKVNHPSNTTYGLMGGTYFLDDINQEDLHYCQLPSSPQDNPQWNKFPCHGPGEGQPGIFVDFGGAVYEHDLIINAISTNLGNPTHTEMYSLELVLLKFSTGEYHPLAHYPRIPLQRSSTAEPTVLLEVAGDNLALTIDDYDQGLDSLFIFDWKTGHKRLQHEATGIVYSYIVFVSPELLLVPNFVLSSFEVWYIPPFRSNPSPPIQILSLKLPAVSPDYSIFDINCRGEPSPFLHSLPYIPPLPFFPSPEDSIITTNVHFQKTVGSRRLSYAFIMHRGALLNTIRQWAAFSPLEKLADQSIWLTNEATVNQRTDPNDKSSRLGAESKSISGMRPHRRSSPLPYGYPDFAPFQVSIPYVSTDPGSLFISSRSPMKLSVSQYDFIQVQWADWGPPISRWFKLNEKQAQWIMNSTGQRFAFLSPNLRDRGKLMVSVADFNQYKTRRNAKMTAISRRECGNDISNGNIEAGKEKGEQEDLEKFDHEGVFAEDVHMGLRCTIYHAPDEYNFDGVLMDENRLLGVKVDDVGREERIKVLYFG